LVTSPAKEPWGSVAERRVVLFPACEERAMPIRQYLNGERFDFETMRVLGVALEMTRCALRTEERGEDTDEIIAKHIIALALGGERDADRLCDYALAKLRETDGRSSQLFQASSEARAAMLKRRSSN
jgi:hypothetical protein